VRSSHVHNGQNTGIAHIIDKISLKYRYIIDYKLIFKSPISANHAHTKFRIIWNWLHFPKKLCVRATQYIAH